MNPAVDAYFSEAGKWQEELEKLRTVLLDCGLTEELKWDSPCYTYHGKNIVIIQGFKEYCGLLFFKGNMLSDPYGILVKTGENTRVGRQLRFTDFHEIAETEAILKTYVFEAIEVEKSGVKVDVDKDTELSITEELQSKFDEFPPLKSAFEALTPGRQRAYVYYFSEAKQSKTRTSRIEKHIPQILRGKGLNEK